MAASNLEQKLAVNPFVNGVKIDKKPEVVRCVDLNNDLKVECALEQFMKIEYVSYSRRELFTDAQVLEPKQINQFLQEIIKHDIHMNSELLSGVYLSSLVQISYLNGYNNFILDIPKLIEIYSFGIKLNGTKDNPLNIIINGDIGGDCGYESTNCVYTINGGADNHLGNSLKNCIYTIMVDTTFQRGYESEECHFDISGNIGSDCGDGSKKCSYTIRGKANQGCGIYSVDCVFLIKGNMKKGYTDCSQGTIFKLMDKDNYLELKKNADRGSILQFVNKQGDVIEQSTRQ